jgi:hypothetical protein
MIRTARMNNITRKTVNNIFAVRTAEYNSHAQNF